MVFLLNNHCVLYLVSDHVPNADHYNSAIALGLKFLKINSYNSILGREPIQVRLTLFLLPILLSHCKEANVVR